MILRLALLASLVAGPALAHEAYVERAPDEPELLFEPPAPGTYELPPIQRVRDRTLLDSHGEPAPLLGLAADQAAVVAFVYRACTDADGCPLALATLRRLDRRLAALPELSSRTRIVTVSFDPELDTPERMAETRALLEPKTDWRFLTAASEAEIGLVLSDFGQDALRRLGSSGHETGVIRHVLKVFLIDGGLAVRNIYSAGFLDARLLLNDIETVLLHAD